MSAPLVTLALPGEGVLCLWEHNGRAAHCVACDASLGAGEGIQHAKARFGRLRSGYLCIACLAFQLEKTDWHKNMLDDVFPALEGITRHPLDGKALAEALRRGGVYGLGAAILGKDAS
jgi:hypothetical protein